MLKWTLSAAVVITAAIAAASFVLSFATLWDLATMSGLPRNLSWLWPVIVDGTILQATISVIALAPYEAQRSGRRFFWTVLTVSALVSISSNALHAFISGAGSLDPALSALIATVAPLSLLSSTHGIAVLSRMNSRRAQPSRTTATDTSAWTDSEEELAREEWGSVGQPTQEGTTPWPNWHEMASLLIDRKLTTRREVVEVAEILRCSFELDMSNRAVAKHLRGFTVGTSTNLHHNTVGRVVDAAKTVANWPGALDGLGGSSVRPLGQTGQDPDANDHETDLAAIE